jgi:hypothetical protein
MIFVSLLLLRVFQSARRVIPGFGSLMLILGFSYLKRNVLAGDVLVGGKLRSTHRRRCLRGSIGLLLLLLLLLRRSLLVLLVLLGSIASTTLPALATLSAAALSALSATLASAYEGEGFDEHAVFAAWVALLIFPLVKFESPFDQERLAFAKVLVEHFRAASKHATVDKADFFLLIALLVLVPVVDG